MTMMMSDNLHRVLTLCNVLIREYVVVRVVCFEKVSTSFRQGTMVSFRDLQIE